jgi:hypothetical protein
MPQPWLGDRTVGFQFIAVSLSAITRSKRSESTKGNSETSRNSGCGWTNGMTDIRGSFRNKELGREICYPYLATSDECGYTEIRRAAGADKLSFLAEEQCTYCVFQG